MNHAWNQSEFDLLFSKKQRAKWYLAVHKPGILAHLQVVSPPNTYPASAIDTLNISGSQYVTEGLTAWVGSTSGASDLGRVRVRRDYELTDPFLSIMESGSGLIRWNDANYITVVDERRPWTKHPRYDTSASRWRMDYDVGHAGQLGNYPPMAVLGAPVVGILNESGEMNASFVGSNSFGFDSPLNTFVWEFPDGSNSLTEGTEADPLVKTFSGASKNGNYVKLTITDMNVASHVGYRLIWAFENEADLPRVLYTAITGGPEQGGYQTQIHTYGLDDLDIAPGTEVVIFESASYGSTASELGGNSIYRNNVVFRGWTTNEQIVQNPDTGVAILNAVTIDGMMNNMPSYDVFYAQASPIPGASEWVASWNLSMDRVAFNLLRWRSNIADICDFRPGSGNAMSTHILYQNLPRADIFSQLRSNYWERGMFWKFSSDMQSALHSFPDPNITGGSAAMDIFPVFSASNIGGTVNVERIFHEPVAQIQLYAVASVTPLGAESPGNVFGYSGGKVEHTQGLTTNSQDELITWSGNLRAKRNAKFKRVVTPLAGNARIDPVPYSIFPLTLPPEKNARRLDWRNKLFIPQELTLTYQQGYGVIPTLVSEEVVDGAGGSAITFPTIISLEPPPPPPPVDPPGPSVGSDIVYVMGTNHLGRTRDFGASNPTWDDVPIPSVTRCLDFILDPWNPKNGGWLATDQGLYRTANLDSSAPSWTQVLSKSAIESALSTLNYRDGYKVVGSINKQGYFAFFFITDIDTISGGANLCCAYTDDNGNNWGFTTIDTNIFGVAGSAWGGAADYVPHLVGGNVVLYAASIDTTPSPPSARPQVFKSTNGGASWSSVGTIGSYTAEDDITPYSVHCPYNSNEDGLDVYVAFKTGIYKSINGSTFSSLGISPQQNINRTSVETYTQDQNVVYIWDSSDNIRVSENNAASFSTRGSVPGTLKAAGGFPFDKQRYYSVSDTGIYASFDGGNNFVDKTGNYPVSALSPSASYNKAVIVPVWVS